MRKIFELIGTLVLGFVLIASVVGFVDVTSVSASHDTPVGDITNLRAAGMAVSHAELVGRTTNLRAADMAVSRDEMASDLTLLDAGDVSAYRWNAMGNFYAAQSADLTLMDAGDVLAYRWIEMGNFYAAQALRSDFNSQFSGEFSAYRLIRSEAGFWTRTALSNAFKTIEPSGYRIFQIEPGFWARSASLTH